MRSRARRGHHRHEPRGLPDDHHTTTTALVLCYRRKGFTKYVVVVVKRKNCRVPSSSKCFLQFRCNIYEKINLQITSPFQFLLVVSLSSFI